MSVRSCFIQLGVALLLALSASGAFAQVPGVVAVSPAQNELNAPAATSISVTFDTDMDDATIDGSSFIVLARSSGFVTGTITYDSPSKTATWSGSSEFNDGDRVTVILTENILSNSGFPLPAPFLWSFNVATAAGSNLFQITSETAVGEYPYCVFPADVNGDGIPDLLSANYVGDNVSVMTGIGNGQFHPAASYPTSGGPTSVVAADFDADGDLDIAASDWDVHNITILLNQGDGSFSTPGTVLPLPDGTNPIAMAAADFDGDGDIDLATANNGSGSVSILMNDGNASFDPPVSYSSGDATYSVVSCDVDSDGDFDLIAANEDASNISVFSNSGDGTFEQANFYDVGTSPSSVVSGDLDGDGDMDLVTANWESDDISVLLNDGSGDSFSRNDYNAGDAVSVAVGDVDGDGDLDAVAACAGSSTFVILRGNGDGTFGSPESYATGVFPKSVALADLDNDGALDVANANASSDNVTAALNSETLLADPASFSFEASENGNNPAPKTFVLTSSGDPISFSVADDAEWLNVTPLSGSTPATITVEIDISGLSYGNYVGSITISDARRNGISFALPVMLTVLPAGLPIVTSVSPDQNQLNVDTSQDVGVTFSTAMNPSTIGSSSFFVTGSSTGAHTGDITYEPSTSTAMFSPYVGYATGEIVSVVLTEDMVSEEGFSLPNGFAWSFTTIAELGPGIFGSAPVQVAGGYPYSVLPADLNGDGNIDLVVANYLSNDLSVLIGTGNGNFQFKVQYPVDDGPTSVAAGDFDGDGDLDLAATNRDASIISVLTNDGSGTFDAYGASYPLNPNSDPNSIIAADLNNDGFVDLATANLNGQSISVLLNGGDGIFGQPEYYTAGASPCSIAFLDLDNDGDFDLICANQESDNIHSYLNSGSGDFVVDGPYDVGAYPSCVTIGDFDGDGFMDIATVDYGYGAGDPSFLSVLINDGTGHLSPRVDYSVDRAAVSVAAGDVNGDGVLDLVATGSRLASIMFGNGDGSFATSIPYAVDRSSISVTLADFDNSGSLDIAAANASSDNISILLNGLLFATQPASLAFSAIEGGVDPASKSLEISAIDSPLDFSISDDAEWLSVAPISGTTPMTVSVDATVNGLSAGSYSGTITISEVARSALPLQVAVTLTIYPAGTPSVISVEPTQNQLNVLGDTKIAVTFGTDIQESTLDNSSIFVNARTTGLHVGAISYDSPSRTAEVTLAEPFDPGEAVSVALTPGIESTTGIPLYGGFEWTFTTVVPMGSGEFSSYEDYTTGNYSYSVYAADLDGDGDPDLAVANYQSDDISVLMNQGDGTFGPQTPYSTGAGPTSVYGADIDADGDVDLVTANYDATSVTVLKNDGEGSLVGSHTYQLVGASSPICIVAADLDSDGDQDIATANNLSHNVTVLLNNGSGTFSQHATLEAGTEPYSITAADLDGDGDIDLAAVSQETNDISVYLSDGGAEFSSQFTYATGYHPSSVVAADLNDDGYADLATANWGDDIVSIRLNNGDGTFGEASNYAAGDAVSLFAVDLDADGDLDLASANAGDNRIAVLLNDGGGTFVVSSTVDVSNHPKSIFCADLNRDGSMDIAAAKTTGSVAVLMNVTPILCGDANSSGMVDIDDIVGIITYIFLGGLPPNPYELGDADCSGAIDIDDVVYLIAYVFASGPTPCDPDNDGIRDCYGVQSADE